MSDDLKWHKGMRPTDRYRVKSRDELVNKVFKGESYHIGSSGNAFVTIGPDTYVFPVNMLVHCRKEITDIRNPNSEHPSCWFCMGFGEWRWLLEWLDPIYDVVREDIDE